MRKKSIRLVSAALAACMMASTLPVGAFALEAGTNDAVAAVSEQEAATPLSPTGGEIGAGHYTMAGGEYTGGFTIDTTGDVTIDITGEVTVKDVDTFLTVTGSGKLTINATQDGKIFMESTSDEQMLLDLNAAEASVEINGGSYDIPYKMFNVQAGTLNINSGKFESECGPIVENLGIVNIKDGIFKVVAQEEYQYACALKAGENSQTTIENGEFVVDAGLSTGLAAVNGAQLTINGGEFTIKGDRIGNQVSYGSASAIGVSLYNGSVGHINGGTFTVSAQIARGVAITRRAGVYSTCIVDGATFKIDGGAQINPSCAFEVDYFADFTLKNATIENISTTEGNEYGDILQYSYDKGHALTKIAESFKDTLSVIVTGGARCDMVTVAEATDYQKDLKLISVYPDYFIDYQKNEDGTEYRYFAKREDGKNYVNPINATMTADGEEKRPYSQFAPGDKVTLTANIPEGKQFVDWKVEKIAAEGVEDVSKEVKIDYEDLENPETAALTMPNYDIFVTAEYEDVIIDPGTGDSDYGGDIAAGVVIGGIAAVGAYEVGTGLYRITQMDDVAMPANRLALAKLLWERAGKPEPESTALYSDISAEDTNVQKAARWAVEQELLNDDDSVEGELKFHPAFPVSKLRVCLTWEKAKQKGLFDQNTEA